MTPWTAACQAVHHQLPELTQTHIHWVGDAIQPSHPSAIPFSSHLQSLPASGSIPWVSSLHQVAKVLEFQLQRQSFQWIFRTEFHNGQILFNNKKDKFVLRGASWVNLENILRQKISQTHWAWFYKLFRKCISIRIKRYRWLQWARGGRMGSNFLQIREFLWGDENTVNTGDGCMNLSL